MKFQVLVVEDSISQGKIYQNLLERIGLSVVVATDAQRGYLQATQAGPFDLILLDRFLPDLDGLKLLKLIQGALKEAIPPVLLVTGYGSNSLGRDGICRPDDWRDYVELGFCDALSKPFNRRSFQSLVLGVLNGTHTKEAMPTGRSTSSNWVEAAESWANLSRAD